MEFVLFGISFRAEQWKLSRRKSSAVTLSLSLSVFSFHLFSLFYLCCSTCSLFSFFFLFYYLSLHPWISILLFIASVAYMHINDESSNRTADRRARRIHFRFVSTRVIIRGEKWEKHLTIVHRVETRGRLMRTRVKNDSSSSLPSSSLLFFFNEKRESKFNMEVESFPSLIFCLVYNVMIPFYRILHYFSFNTSRYLLRYKIFKRSNKSI